MTISKHPKEYAAWVSAAKNNRQGNAFQGNAFLAAESPTWFRSIGKGACHGAFYGYGTSFKDCDILWSWKMGNAPNSAKEAEPVYVEWLTNKSPWEKAFLIKDYSRIKEGGHAVRTDLPYDYVLSALVATRFFTEVHTNWTVAHTQTFADLLGKGVDPGDAFLMAIMYKKVDSSYQYQMPNGHEILPQHWTMGSIAAFVKGEYNPKTPLFKVEGGYRSIGTAWDYAHRGPSTLERAKVWGEVKAIKGVDYNIFRRPDPNAAYPKLSLETLIGLIPTIKKEANAA